MKYRVLVKKIRDEARAQGVTFERRSQSGSHEKWYCGTVRIVIPKHTEVNEMTAESICKDLEPELGERWWR